MPARTRARRSQLKVFLAGRVAVEANGVVIEEQGFPGRQGRLLFAYLVAEQGRPVPRDELAEVLWADAPPATWEKALTVLVSKLRGLLAESGFDRATALTSAFGCYRLSLPQSAWVDVIAAADAVHEAEAALTEGELEQAKALAMEAATLARPPFLPGEDGAWVDEKRRELTAIVRRALSCVAEACLRSGDEAAAAKWAEETIALDPYRETGYRRLMEAYAAGGDRAEALRVYERCRRLLAEELGAYPSPETDSLYRELLAAPPPEPRASPKAVAPERKRGSATRRRTRRTTFIATAGVLALAGAAVGGVLGIRAESSGETTVGANAVGLVDADGRRVRDQIRVDASPTSVAFGHGAVWVTNAYANTVSRIDPETRSVRQTISVGNSPSGIAVGEGGVWVANHADGTVSWINPDSNTVVGQIRVGNGPTAVGLGYGSLWVTNSDDRTLSRIDLAGGAVHTIRTGAIGRGIAIGGGSVWVSDEAARAVVQIDPGTSRVTNTANVGSGAAGIVYANGALWVANELDGTVSELDARTLAVRAAIPVAESPSALAVGEDGLWVSDEFGQRVVRIDTRTRRESAALHLGNRPKGLVAVPGGVWVAVQGSGAAHRGGRLVVIGDDFDSIDPALAHSTDAFALLGLAYDGLTAFRRVGGSDGTQLVADLAAALPLPTDGGRSYTFRVRTGVRYSNGSLLRAEDFKRGLERMLAANSPKLEGSALLKIRGASSCTSTKACDLSRGVVVRGEGSLTIRLSRPDSGLLLALTSVVPLPRATPPDDIGTQPVPATGPYAIETYVPHRRLKLIRNRHFRSWSEHARPNGYTDEIVWRLDVPSKAAVRQVVHGKADVLLNTVPADRVEELAARYPRQVHLIPQRATAFIFLNTRRAPFDDVRVRRALNYAVDRKRMADLHGGSAVAAVTCQVVPPTVPGFRPYCPYTVASNANGAWKAPDVAKAQTLVAASGTKGQRVVVSTFPFFAQEARYLVSLLSRLGYRAKLKEFRRIDAYFKTINREPSVQAGFAGWFGSETAAEAFSTLTCAFAQNWARYCDPVFDRAVNRLAAVQTDDPGAGVALAARLDRQIVARAPWVPLFTPRLADFTSKRVRNYQPNTYAASTVLLDQLWVR
jgi:YVTN family beta-propeller protein